MFLLGQQLGKYQIVKTLGSGGFGTVYLVRDTWIDKKLAIKVPHKQNGEFDDLLQEPRLLAALAHENIVSIVTAEKAGEYFFIVMEFVEGESLEARIQRDKNVELRVAMDFARQIVTGVDHAHRQGILHRDLRPGNVLVTPEGRIKITDFGTSRFLEVSDRASTVIGSPPYMAPEQFRGRGVFASDIYSIGVMMYEMMTGVLPYFSADPRRLEQMAASGRFTRPRERNRGIPPEIDEIIVKALAPQVSDRYQQAHELLDDLCTAGEIDHRASRVEDIRQRVRARERSIGGFCWNCRKPLHARARACPFCGESQ
ncbi:MAG TPA: serine/threonine-protein kinase [Vicinamibacteria bacterium]|nr:serine/threonine-protein kinase [Vicinamibacteria bacterium]